MMPTFWQMFHGERKVGVSVHYMAPKVDDGPMLLQESMDILPGESLHELIRRSKRHGAHCMAKALRMLADNSAVPFRPSGEPSYFTFPTAEEISAFARKGLRAI
jgi:methionyl-tRNA formyltransferase